MRKASFAGMSRSIAQALGIARKVLTSRLGTLVAVGILERHA